MKMKQVRIHPSSNIYDWSNAPPTIEEIPVIDGVRELIPSAGYWEHDGQKHLVYGCTQYALEQDIDNHILGFMKELMPYIEWLKEQGHQDYIERAYNTALTRRNSCGRSRITGAKIMGDMTRRYREISEALRSLPAQSNGRKLSIEVHTYDWSVLLLLANGVSYSCIIIHDDGTYSAGSANGLHWEEDEGMSRTKDACLVVNRAVEIAENIWLQERV